MLGQELRTLSGGQRRRVEPGADPVLRRYYTLLLDEPTNHLDADSIVWLRGFLQGYSGGLLVTSHDVGLLETTVNKVYHLDANRAELDVYSMDWKRYLLQRETDEKRRKRERANAEQGGRAGAGRQDASQGDEKPSPPRTWPAGREAAGRPGGAARVRQGGEDPGCPSRPCPARSLLTASELSKSYGSLEVFAWTSTWRSTEARRWSCWG